MLAAVLAVAGCSKGGVDSGKVAELEKRLEAQNERIDKLETFLKPFMNQPPPPPEPDPAAVYAVSIDGNPFKGAADAPVTIVEAFEFA